jgi:2-polyprenyl-3-methyl-5-hydroxy-6-metoxy-1,4-benzoquinol methylase
MKMLQIQFKNFIHLFLGRINISIRKSLSPYFNLFGFEFYMGRSHTAVTGAAGFKELVNVLDTNYFTILDVGMGDGRLFEWLSSKKEFDFTYEGLDLGESNDFKKIDRQQKIKIHRSLFNDFLPSYKYDIVFLSHFIEHQGDLQLTLKKLSELIKQDGIVVFEWPLPHRRMIGGHINMLTPALLAYNLAKAGFDMSQSRSSQYGFYCTLIFKNIKFSPVKQLKYDTGEIEQLSGLLPCCIFEGSDSWVTWDDF